MINAAQRRAARIAGAAFLLTTTLVVAVNFGVNSRLLVAGNASETARNILAHERLFRLGIAGNLIYSAGLLVLLSALYVLFRNVDPLVALVGALCRFAFAATWALVALNSFSALRLLSGANYLRPLGPDAVQALARFYLSSFDQYYTGLLFYGLAAAACGWLLLKSHYLPWVLGVIGVSVSLWCVACTLLLYVIPNFSRWVNLWFFDAPMVLFEIVLGVWLLVKNWQD